MDTSNITIDPAIFKAYDVRGIYGQDLTDERAYRIGRAAAQYLHVPEMAVGRDMRLSSPQLAAALIRGVTDQGVNAIDLGMTTTDELYFAVSKFKPLKVVIDAGNGMAGLMMPRVFSFLPCELVPLYFDLDGNFPNHPASPIEPENMEDLQKKIREVGADLGAAFDGDADRMFPVDEHGDIVDGSMVTAIVSNSLLHKYPGSTILYNLIVSKSVPELINTLGGKPVRTRVGHSYIKAEMRQLNGIFGGEHSGHFYFRDNWFADSGLIAFLITLELVSIEGKPLSELLKPLDKGVRSGEINSVVSDAQGKLHALEERYSREAESVDHLDGLTFDYGDWWFNVRPSNTEPLLRVNVEARTRTLMEQKRDDILALIRG